METRHVQQLVRPVRPTPRQHFFVSYAQLFCGVRRPASAAARLRTDPHAPGRFRVEGPLAGFGPFLDAFQCSAGSRYAAPPPCEMW